MASGTPLPRYLKTGCRGYKMRYVSETDVNNFWWEGFWPGLATGFIGAAVAFFLWLWYIFPGEITY